MLVFLKSGKQPLFATFLGAMENWGLVTYRETALLYNPATSSIKDQDWVAIVIAHELSHQWFGDLVTMKWWNDLWLNEGNLNSSILTALRSVFSNVYCLRMLVLGAFSISQ